MAEIDASDPLVWIDCEMTGLNPDKDLIIEIFCLVTNGKLELLDEEGFGVVIHQTQETLDSLMDDWCTRTHGNSGLTARVLASTTTADEAADALLAYIQRFVPQRRVALLAGNSVHADKAFLRKEPYKKVDDYLHHRIVDVSSIKEAARRWCPPSVVRKAPTKKGLHQARADIVESIEEAKYYQKVIFERSTQS